MTPGDTVNVRDATAADAPFLAEMLLLAAYWRHDVPPAPVDEVFAAPDLAHYVVGWPRPGDAGVVAESDRHPVGATWWRCLTADDPGYGFVAADIPELTIGVLRPWRGRGVGSLLIRSLVHRARDAGLTALSLSVERDNAAARLYERLGFRTVRADAGAFTMLLRL